MIAKEEQTPVNEIKKRSGQAPSVSSFINKFKTNMVASRQTNVVHECAAM